MTEASSVVVRIDGEIDMATASVLRERLVEAITTTEDPVVVVDLSDVVFMDSSGMAVLVSASRRLRSADRELVLRGASPAVLSALRMTRLDAVLRIDESPVESDA